MPEIYLLSTLLMGLFLIAVAVAVSRNGQRATPSGHAGARSGFAEWSGRADQSDSRLVAVASNPATWTIGFIVIALALMGGAILLLEGGVGASTGVIQSALVGLAGAVLLGYVFFGAYFAARDRIGQTAAAVAVASVTIGVVVLLAIAFALVTA